MNHCRPCTAAGARFKLCYMQEAAATQHQHPGKALQRSVTVLACRGPVFLVHQIPYRPASAVVGSKEASISLAKLGGGTVGEDTLEPE